jgi:hypothetical protein
MMISYSFMGVQLAVQDQHSDIKICSKNKAAAVIVGQNVLSTYSRESARAMKLQHYLSSQNFGRNTHLLKLENQMDKNV